MKIRKTLYQIFIIILALFTISCTKKSELKKEIKKVDNTVTQTDNFKGHKVIEIELNNLPRYILGKGNVKKPLIIKAQNPEIRPYTGIKRIKPGYSYFPLSENEIAKGIKPKKTKPPIILQKNNKAIKKPFITPFIKKHSDTIISPKKYYVGKDTLDPPIIVKISESIDQKTIHPLLGNTLKPPIIVKCKKPIVVPAITPLYKENAILSIKYLNVEQGLNSQYISCLIEDKAGNIWIGTSGGGLCQYDGKFFTYYTTENGLSSNSIRCLYQDSKGNLWIGTNGAGLCFFDGESFITYTTEQGLINNTIRSIIEDNKGNIWIGSEKGISCFNGKYFIHYTTKQGLSNDKVLSLYRDRKGNIWIGTYRGGVNCFDGQAFTHYTSEQGLSYNEVWSIIEDKNGNMCFGTSNGLNFYDGKSFTIYSVEQGLKDSVIWSIIEDRFGNLWFSTQNGVSCYDGECFINITTEHGLTENYVRSIIQDRTGNLWLGTWGGGLCRLEYGIFLHFTTKQGLSCNNVWSIIEDKKKNLWFATSGGGICCFNGDYFKYYTTKQGLTTDIIWSIIEDKNGNLWFGTNGGGAYCFTGTHFIQFTIENGLSDNKIWKIYEDKSGNIWFGTDEGGVCYYDGNSFVHITKKQGLTDNTVLSILEDRKGNLWFGTYEGGVCFYDKKLLTYFTKENGLSSNTVYTLLEDKYGNIWIGGNNGITIVLNFLENITSSFKKNHIHKKLKKINEIFNKGVEIYFNKTPIIKLNKDNFLIDNRIYALFEDKKNNVWIGCNKGLIKIHGLMNYIYEYFREENKGEKLTVENIKNMFREYGIKEGFIGGDVWLNSVCEDSEGNIWWGAGKCLTKYNPRYDLKDSLPPSIVLKNIKLFFEEVKWEDLKNAKFSHISKWNPIPQNLSLPYNKNHITFNYVGISWSRPDKIMYQFMLEGLDKDWNPPTEKTEVTYSNLPHNKYTFKVRAINDDGIYSKPMEYKFEIRPPWWKTWWFRTIYIVSSIIILISIYMWRTAALRKRQKELEQEIQKATAEIKKQRDEIAMQRDLVIKQKEQIEQQKKDIIDSINYAKKIQEAILPRTEEIKNILNEFFILYMPRDIVSGDFYYINKVNEWLIIAVGDCTGHGVPGAFMTMLGISFLTEIVRKREITKANQALNELRKEIISALQQKGITGEQKDGMDIGLVAIQTETLFCQYAGANNTLYLLRKENNIEQEKNETYKLIEYKGDKMPVAIYERMDDFTNHEIYLKKGDMLYLFTDGYADQFGGDKCKKFTYKRFKELILSNANKTMKEQKLILEKTIINWKNNFEQTDDITVIGFKI